MSTHFKCCQQFHRKATAVAVFVTLAGVMQLEHSVADDAQKSDPQTGAEGKALNYRWSVVDKESGQGVPNARVTVIRSTNIPNGYRVIEETSHITDAKGKYEVVVPPDQVAIESLRIEGVIDHDNYARTKFSLPLSTIRKLVSGGVRPFIEKMELYPGESVMGTVVSPDGKPLQNIKVQVYSKPATDESMTSGIFNDCLTDAEGRFRLSVHKDSETMLWVIPKDFAAIEKFLARKRGDLGVFTLSEGVRVSGRVWNVEGKPLAKVPVQIQIGTRREMGSLNVGSSVGRGAFSDDEGRFECDPLPAGEYYVKLSGLLGDPLIRDFKFYDVPEVFAHQKIKIPEGARSQSVTIRALPHVIVSGQFYDSQGQKFAGFGAQVSGQFDGGPWNATTRPDKDGAFSTRIPHGLQRAYVNVTGTLEQAVRYRRGKDQLLQNKTPQGAELGAVIDDVEDLEFIFYKSPVVLISAVDEEQKPVPSFRVVAAYPWGKQTAILKGGLRSDLRFEDLPDGRYKTQQMLPDEDVTFKLTAAGFEPASKMVRLAEGETQELVVTMKKEASKETKVDVGKD